MARRQTITPEELPEEKVYLEGKGRRLAIILGIVGMLLIFVAWFAAQGSAGGAVEGQRRFLFAYLTAFVYVASLSLGGLFFVLLQHITRAAWSVVVRRMAEVFASNLFWV